jgi:hypothetical protein
LLFLFILSSLKKNWSSLWDICMLTIEGET